MNKQLLFLPGLFVLGILVGIVIMNVQDDAGDGYEPAEVANTGDLPVDADISAQSSKPWSLLDEPGDVVPVQLLEEKVADMETRISELEQLVASLSNMNANTKTLKGSPGVSQRQRMLTTEALVKAGISEEMATDMVRRRNDLELRKLELRDRASREGYLRTKRYMRELYALMAEEVPLRDELGDDAYDRYLYVNGQVNRVKIASVMMGSAAEQAGMKAGDLVLSYGQRRVFQWGELKRDTGKGELGEYVNVDILRDGELMSLWVPRGPLGVRLGSARVDP